MATVNNTNGGVTYGQSTATVDAPQDSDNDFLCAVQLQRIANSLETIIDMIKKDQEETKKRWEEKDIEERNKSGVSNVIKKPKVKRSAYSS